MGCVVGYIIGQSCCASHCGVCLREFFGPPPFVNGEGLEQGTLAATTVLIAVVRLVKLESKSSSIEISVGARSLLSSVVRCLQNLSQSTRYQLSFSVSCLCSIDVLRVVAIRMWSVHGGWRSLAESGSWCEWLIRWVYLWGVTLSW